MFLFHILQDQFVTLYFYVPHLLRYIPHQNPPEDSVGNGSCHTVFAVLQYYIFTVGTLIDGFFTSASMAAFK